MRLEKFEMMFCVKKQHYLSQRTEQSVSVSSRLFRLTCEVYLEYLAYL